MDELNVLKTKESSSTPLKEEVRVSMQGTVGKNHPDGYLIQPKPSKYEPVFCASTSVDCEFPLFEGDYVELEGTISKEEEANPETRITLKQVYPHGVSVTEGMVTKWDGMNGCISSFAEFDLLTCAEGYCPKLRDRVIGVFIKCNKLLIKHRAIRVVPTANMSSTAVRLAVKELREHFVKERADIVIDECCKVFVDIGQRKEVTINASNQGFLPRRLKAVYNMTIEEVLDVELIKPAQVSMEIQSGGVVEFTFLITGKQIGRGCSHFRFAFDEPAKFISSFIEVEVVNMSLVKDLKTTTQIVFAQQRFSASLYFEVTSGKIVPPPKLPKPVTTYAIPLPRFPLPIALLTAAMPDEPACSITLVYNILMALPSLTQELSPTNYLSRMHSLLYLEEVARLKEVGEMGIYAVKLKTGGDCHILEVPLLSPYTTRLSEGDSIVVRKADRSDIRIFKGRLVKKTATELWIRFSNVFGEIFEIDKRYDVLFLESRTSIRRMHQAIELAVSNMGTQWLFPKAIETRECQVHLEEMKTSKRYSQRRLCTDRDTDILARLGKQYTLPQMEGCTELTACLNANINRKKISWFNKDLNIQQKQAVVNILLGEARPLPYIIFGPPGTGKTDTIVELVLQLHSLMEYSKILVASPSNSAVDLLAERLLGIGNLCKKDILRLVGHFYGQQDKMPSHLIPYSLKAESVIRPKKEKGGPQTTGNKLNFEDYRITLSTLGCHGVMHNIGLGDGFYTHVIVDEAGQATEPETLIPAAFLDRERAQLILAGDPLQLGPVVTSRLAAAWGLQDSFLSRVLKTPLYAEHKLNGYDSRLVTKLSVNYRSLPRILQLSSMLFYDDSLIPHISECDDGAEGNLLKILGERLPCHKNGRAPPLLFHGVVGSCSQVSGSHSRYNMEEVSQSILYLRLFYEAGLTPAQVGIITPYQLQVKYMRNALEKLQIALPKIGSIEEFQGQERMTIILSLVRSCRKEEAASMSTSIAFVSNEQRLNVALTRAKAVLIIIGNPYLLSSDSNWYRVIDHCAKNGSYVGCPLPDNFNPPPENF